ncbi:MAG: hypothetical protein J6V80_02390 [Clostridia bacterium]|nr:hypothetical protein [Clostridia bacterium]
MKTKHIILLVMVFVFVMALASCDVINGAISGLIPNQHEHSWVDATCDTPKTCSECGETEGEALGHTEETLAGKPATCTEAGITEGKKCTVCGAVTVEQKETSALGHDIVKLNAISPTCTEAGLTAGEYCTVCDYKVAQEEISATGHTEVIDEAVAPTCTQTGLTEGKHCSVCKEVFVDRQVVPANGHTEAIDEAKAPTCSVPGLTEGKHCSVCKEVLVAQNGVPATGHTAGAAADCLNAQSCTTCGEELVPAKGHSAGDAVIENRIESTCSALGSYDKVVYCSVCDTELSRDSFSIPSASHTPGEVVVENQVAASCTANGSYDNVVYCSVCEAEISRDTMTIPALPHTEEIVAGKEPTCTETGLTAGKKCADCGETLLAQEELPAKGHSFVNCECSVCDAVLPVLGYADSFDFTTADGYNAALAGGKLGFAGEAFRNNGDSHQFGATSNIQFVVPANTIVTITGHSANYGIFDIYLNGEKADLGAGGVYKFTVTEETKVVITPNEEKTYQYAYIKGIALEAYVDRTINADTTISFGSEGNYKESIVDFSGIQIGDNGGNNSQVKNGSFDLILKAGAKVVIHGYPGYTSYQLNGGEEIKDEYYIYLALEATTLKVTPVEGNNYFYSIEITYHEGIELVEAKESTCSVAGHEAYYSCSCHGELTEKVTLELADHNFVDGKCSACGAVDPSTRITVYFENNWLWTEVSVHYWGSASNPDTTWPGIAPTKVGSVNGHDVYEIVLPADITGFIINGLKDDGSGNRDQTPDIKTGLANCVCYYMHWDNGNQVKTSEYHINETTTVAPDCINSGSETNVCQICGKSETKELPAKGHTEETLAGKDATCTDSGITEGIRCSVCEVIIKAQEEIPANGHSEHPTFNNNYHWIECEKCDYESEKVAHTPADEGKCACGYACDDKCEICGKCNDLDCDLCAAKCEFANTNEVINFAPSYVLAAPEGPGGLAPGKDGAYIHDKSITAQHVILSNGAYATVITLPNGTAAHSGVSFANNKENATSGQLGYNYAIPQLKDTPKVLRLHFTNNGDTTVSFRYDAIDYYWEKGSVELTLAAGESKTVLLVATHTNDSIGLNHQIVFPNGADAGASITVWGEFVADERMNAITIATPATQLRFGVGETFSAAGLVLKAKGTGQDRVYINGNYVTNLDGYTFTADDVGTHTVFVMFADNAVAYQIIVDDHIHNIAYIDQQDPIPCEKDGLAAHYECTVDGCGMMFEDQHGNKILESIQTVSCHTESAGPNLPGTPIACAHCGALMGVSSMDNWVHFAITTSTSKIGSNIVNGRLEHGYVDGVPGTKVYIGAGTKGATNDSEFYLKMSDNDAGWQTVIPNLGANAPAGQLRRVILFYKNYSNEAVTMNLQNDAKGGNGKVTIPANGTAICEFTIKNSGGSNWFHYYVDSNINSDVVLGVYGYFYVYSEEVDSISINKPATKLTYKVGESFTSEGLVVNVPITMSNSKTCYAQTGFTTDYDGRAFTAEDIGTHTVTVTFGDNTTTYIIDVVPEVDCSNGEHSYGKVSDESLFVEMQGNNAVYKKACVYCGVTSEETYVAETIAFVPAATNKDNYSVEYVILDDGRIAVKLTAKTDIPAGTTSSISTNINSLPAGTNLVFPVSGNGRRVYMEMLSNADVNITWQPEFYGDRDGVTMDLKAGEAQSSVWVIKYDASASNTKSGLPYEEFVFNSNVAAGTEIYITGLFYERGEVVDVSIKTPANKIVFKVGDSFSSTGIILGVASGEEFFDKVSITNVTTNLDGKVFTDADLGTHKVVVSWGDYTVEYDILVIK